MRATMADKLASYGNWTYRGAWVLEVAAALIGLSTGIALGYQAFSSSQSANSTDLILASAPFFIVALAELTKIPTATLLFASDWKWKPLILIFMLALAGITFETVFMGLERAAALRQLPYEQMREDIDQKRLTLEGLKSALEVSANTNPVADAQNILTDLTERAKQDHATTQDQIDQIDKQLSAAVTLSPAATQAQGGLAEAKKERDDKILAQKQETDEAVGQFERQRDSYVKRIEIYKQSGDNAAAAKTQAQLDALVNPRPGLDERHQVELQPLLDRVAQLQSTFDRELAASTPMTDTDRSTLQKHRAELVDRLAQVTKNWDGQIDDAQQRLADAQTAQVNKDAVTNDNLKQQEMLNQEINKLEGDRIPIARADQIRRIAGRFFGVKPEDVSEDQADLISIIWFGSLAALAALAGPVTATVALALQRIAANYDRPLRRRGLFASWTRLVHAWRWHRVRTVKVPFEVKVEVEKEVEKRVEVPVETVIKEFLYIPVLTDDPAMALSMMRTNLSPDAAAAVEAAMKRALIPDVPVPTPAPAAEMMATTSATEVIDTLSEAAPAKRARRASKTQHVTP